MNTPNVPPEWEGHPPYAFSPHLAQALNSKGSTTDALILGHMHHVIQSEDAPGDEKGGFVRDGHKWRREAAEDLYEKHFYWLSKTTVWAAFKRLEGLGLLISTNQYRRESWDRTKSHAIDYAKLHELLENTPKGVKTKRNKRLPPEERTPKTKLNYVDRSSQHVIDEPHEPTEAAPPHELPEPQHEHTDAPPEPPKRTLAHLSEEGREYVGFVDTPEMLSVCEFLDLRKVDIHWFFTALENAKFYELSAGQAVQELVKIMQEQGFAAVPQPMLDKMSVAWEQLREAQKAEEAAMLAGLETL